MYILLLSLLLPLLTWADCTFQKDVKSLYSLSGPVTLMLKDLNLLNSPVVKAVSIFHPVAKQDFKGELLPGGVFLSPEKIQSLTGSLVFYDESRELERIFSRYPKITAIAVKTRGLTPMDAHKMTAKVLSPYLDQCDLKAPEQQLSERLTRLQSLIKKKPAILFFLGKIGDQRLPELLIVQDGAVKWLIQQQLIQTYPSPLGYVNWSAKVLIDYGHALKIGVIDPGNKDVTELVKTQSGYNLTYPGALIPGRGQVEALIYLFEKLNERPE